LVITIQYVLLIASEIAYALFSTELPYWLVSGKVRGRDNDAAQGTCPACALDDVKECWASDERE